MKDLDAAVAISELGRFRVDLFHQRKRPGMVLRTIGTRTPTIEQLQLPEVLKAIPRPWSAAPPARLAQTILNARHRGSNRPALDTRASLSDSDRTMTPFERGLIAHLVADWILQNDWMARHKTSLRHPAAWTHSAVHGLCLTLALGWVAGVVLGVVHLLIDTRVPVTFWMRHFKGCGEAPNADGIAVWLDQSLHIIAIAAWVTLAGS